MVTDKGGMFVRSYYFVGKSLMLEGGCEVICN
jgi:hypothetical protein